MENLTIYTASAGSGKTYQLALNYIRLLFETPDAYQRILAVTFTNKASSEMKRRILDKLNQLSLGDARADDYARYLLQNSAATSIEELKRKSESLLKNILHNYSAFYVQTIDKFFQWVIRGFTREIGLQNGYTLEFNRNGILSEAVDRLIFSMEEDPQLKKWLVRFAQEKITQGKSWDINTDIKGLGQEVFRESYQALQIEVQDSLSMKEKFLELIGKLDMVIAEFEKSLQTKGALALQIIENAGIPFDDFKHKEKGIPSFFKKAAFKAFKEFTIADRIRNSADNFSMWTNKGNANENILKQLYNDSLNELLKEIIDIWDSNSQRYFTAIVLRSNLDTYGILNDIAEKIHEITRERNLFLISDSSLFIKNIIAENDAPFIYEKAGNYFNHFMLDEFQDTSRFQWDNFLPLIQNSLAGGYANLIVGDVKQSIYRWRNSDWKILAGEINESISESRIRQEKLNVNYRSSRNIIAFNNALFSSATKILHRLIHAEMDGREMEDYALYWSDLSTKIYGEPRQHLAPGSHNEEGYICCKFETDSGKEDNLEYLRKWIPATIMDLQNRNFQAKDITILVRTSNEGRQVVRILMDAATTVKENYNFNLISNDSLVVGNNPAVKFLIALFRFFKREKDQLIISYLRHEYFSYINSRLGQIEDGHLIFTGEHTNLGNLPDMDIMVSFMQNLEEYRKLPLYELSERLIHFFHLNQLQDDIAYIQAIQDIILEFSRKETSDLGAFLDAWESTLKLETLNVSETQDALRIMTIHKAKGLEFKVVIIPFCDWNLPPESSGNKRTILWPETKGTEFNEFSHVPVAFGSNLRSSFFVRDYYEETYRTYIDNLNLLYVAFTRAEKELHTFSLLSKKPGDIKSVGDFFHSVISGYIHDDRDHAFPMADLQTAYDPENGLFAYGKPAIAQPEQDRPDSFITSIFETYPVTNISIKLNLNHKNIYLSDLKEDEKGYTGYGTQMHEIFAGIISLDAIDEALRKAWLKGLLNSEERDQLANDLRNKLSASPFSSWFSKDYTCKMEQEIISRGGDILRPDRIMIKGRTAIVLDYKFGHLKKDSYKRQVKDYYKALKELGFENVSLFLWYYNLGELEEVMP